MSDVQPISPDDDPTEGAVRSSAEGAEEEATEVVGGAEEEATEVVGGAEEETAEVLDDDERTVHRLLQGAENPIGDVERAAAGLKHKHLSTSTMDSRRPMRRR